MMVERSRKGLRPISQRRLNLQLLLALFCSTSLKPGFQKVPAVW